MCSQRVLTIEDDPAIRRGIVDALTFAGYHVIEAADGAVGLKLALERAYDLLLLDLVLPSCDGHRILREVRDARPTLPVIVLTARGDEDDRVLGLRNGADDYVVKPFSVKELLARIEAVLRRSPARPIAVEQCTLGEAVVDFNRREVCFDDGRREALSQREAELLRYLVVHAGRALRREELLAHVWGLDPRGVNTRTVDMHIARLREKLRDTADPLRVILTVHGQGYMIGAP